MTFLPKHVETLFDDILILLDGHEFYTIGNVLAHVLGTLALRCESSDIISIVAKVALQMFIEESKESANH